MLFGGGGVGGGGGGGDVGGWGGGWGVWGWGWGGVSYCNDIVKIRSNCGQQTYLPLYIVQKIFLQKVYHNDHKTGG